MRSRQVQLVDIKSRISPMRAELRAAFDRVIDSGVFVMGPESHQLEEEFAAYCGVNHGVSVSSGTAALHLALLALDIGPRDEVITVSNTFIATLEAISATGATPVVVDIEPDTHLMDVRALEAAVTNRTRAIIPVHLYGLPCDMKAIRAVAHRHGIPIVEDACQAHGALYEGSRTGSLGTIGCFSLYPTKNLGTIGEGGMAVTNDAALAARMRSLRSHGESERYRHLEPGWNLRMPELMAAAARLQLSRLDDWNARRRHVAAWYAELMSGLPVVLPVAPAGREHVYHLYVVAVDDRERVRRALASAGVVTAVHYPVPAHLQPAYSDLRSPSGGLPRTELAATRILSLPMYPELTHEQVAVVAEAMTLAISRSPEAA